MQFPARFENLPDYAFPRLRTLLTGHEPGGDVLDMTIGEPKHGVPDFIAPTIAENTAGFAKYPPNNGTDGLRGAIADWIGKRFDTPVDPDTQILPLNGTREGLFNVAVACIPEARSAGQRPLVLVPNPFYQVYAVAALAVGAEPVYVRAGSETGFLPDFGALPDAVLDRAAVIYACSPSNPQGAVADRAYLESVIALAEKHDIQVYSDECYSEIYRDAPPLSALQVARDMGADPERVLIFHSLSKRSNIPGLRAGFVAGGPASIARMKQLRAYAGAPPPLPLQMAAEVAWRDEAHVTESRDLYRAKFDIADRVFDGVPGYMPPQAGFFLWLPVEDGEAATLALWRETGIKVLPGAYLAREVDGDNPGHGYIRVAMVTKDLTDLERGLKTIRGKLYS